MFRSFGVWEIVLILVIILIIFGVGKLPQVGSAIGKGLRSFKKAQSGEEEAEEKEEEEAKGKEKAKTSPSKAKKAGSKKAAKS
jgi:sec-independent protein translocase protein TatA